MPAAQPGTCLACKTDFDQRTIGRHLAVCEKRKSGAAAPRAAFHVSASAPGGFWLHFEATNDATLRDVDEFLRDTWLECCGHLSAFRVGQREFVSSEDSDEEESGEGSMDIDLREVASPGLQFSHEYDFGSTTTLRLKIVGVFEESTAGRARVRLLARNRKPALPCAKCKSPSASVCSECFLGCCAACSAKHPCGQDMLLPFSNSPRAGVCGYAGSDEEPITAA